MIVSEGADDHGPTAAKDHSRSRGAIPRHPVGLRSRPHADATADLQPLSAVRRAQPRAVAPASSSTAAAGRAALCAEDRAAPDDEAGHAPHRDRTHAAAARGSATRRSLRASADRGRALYRERGPDRRSEDYTSEL